jgi:Cu2+-containing amine oxidase
VWSHIVRPSTPQSSWWLIQVYNYDYIVDFVFYANGVVEQTMYATGYLQAGTFEHPEQDKFFGFKYSNEAGGTLHMHNLLWKVDLDVAGTSNSFSITHIKARGVYHPYLKQPIIQHYIDTEFAETEEDAQLNVNLQKPAVMAVVNEGAKNKWGSLRGYATTVLEPQPRLLRISAGQLACHLVLCDE